MKSTKSLKIALLGILFAVVAACGSGNYKGSASDTTGNNGATNGTGKIAK